VLISVSAKIDLCPCEDFEECFEDVLAEFFDGDLAETFEGDLDESFEDDLDECLEVVDCFFAEPEASGPSSSKNWDVL
jgi:hypothetical protein